MSQFQNSIHTPVNYSDIIKFIMEEGQAVSSRYGETREVLDQRIMFESGELMQRKGWNTKLALLEAFQVVGGYFDAEQIKKLAPKARHELFTYEMSYGPRLGDQPQQVVDLLERDWQSRQAVIYIGSQADGMTNAQPCTTSIQFLLRDSNYNHGKGHTDPMSWNLRELHCFVSMRSWDAYLGLPNDIMVFALIQQVIARMLRVTSGRLHVRAGSLHHYVKNTFEPRTGPNRFLVHPYLKFSEWKTTQEWARRMAEYVTNGINIDDHIVFMGDNS